MRRTVLSLALAAVCAAPALAQTVEGTIDRVTLYRDQALVTRTITTDAAAGAVTLLVSNLPERVVPDSLFASATGDGVDIRAVRFRTRAVSEEPRGDVREIDAKLRAVADKLREAASKLALVAQQEAYIARLESHSLTASRAEVAKGTLNTRSLRELTTFLFEQRTKLAASKLTAERARETLVREQQLLQRQRAELAAGSTRTVREALVFLDHAAAGKLTLTLSYEVTGVGWRPFYNLRATGGQAEMRLGYHAAVVQASGEDWKGVALTLSTASPQLRAQGPDVAPFNISLHAGQSKQQVQAGQQMYSSAQKQLQAALRNRLKARDRARNDRFNWEMNKWANECQNLELTLGNAVLDRRRRNAGSSEGLSVSYRIAGKASLASRGDQQLIRIAALELKASTFHVAAPVLTSYVYRHADLTNGSETAFLAGALNVYVDGQFVGSGEMPEVSPGQVFTVGLGANSQLRASRELVERNERIQGGNRVIALSYKLKLRNFSGKAVAVRLLDRLPTSGRDNEIRVTLGKLANLLSTDKLYLADERPHGLLRWDLSVPANASGEKTLIVPYAFTMEFDRTKTVASPTPQMEQQLKQQFERMQQNRYKSR